MVWGFEALKESQGWNHTTVIIWVKQVGERLPDVYDPQTTPEGIVKFLLEKNPN